ncbi:MAG: hypothetical protein Q4G59_01945, partial [Planctomycetia bacterium]|nr:hypothetical protein [Planctomycetia bacterium]
MEYRNFCQSCVAWFIIMMLGICHVIAAESDEYRKEVQKDWQRQEKDIALDPPKIYTNIPERYS